MKWKSLMVPLLVLFPTGIRVRKLDLFFANFKKLLKTRIFLANSKMLKTLWFRVCIREETEPMKSDMVPFLVPFRKEIMVPKVDQEMELVKKRNLINNAS